MQGKGSAGSGTYRFKMKEGRATVPMLSNHCPSTQCLSSLWPIPTPIFDHYIPPSNFWVILRILPPKRSSRIRSLWYTSQEQYPRAWHIPSCACTTGYNTSNSTSVNHAKDVCMVTKTGFMADAWTIIAHGSSGDINAIEGKFGWVSGSRVLDIRRLGSSMFSEGGIGITMDLP